MPLATWPNRRPGAALWVAMAGLAVSATWFGTAEPTVLDALTGFCLAGLGLVEHPGGAGYLLKQRVSNLGVLTDALERLRDGECVIDPTIVARLVQRARPVKRLAELTDRERDVLALMAEGRTNRAIAASLFLSPKTVEAHVKHIFQKLDLDESPDDHRRVLAVLAYLRS